MRGLETLTYHFSEPQPLLRRKAKRSAPVGSLSEIAFDSDEAAARYYLHQLLDRDTRPAMRGVLSQPGGKLAPGLRRESVREIRWPQRVSEALTPAAKKGKRTTVVVRFQQIHLEKLVFGSGAIIELDGPGTRRLLTADVNTADLGEAKVAASLSESEALNFLAEFVQAEKTQLHDYSAAQTYFFRDQWCLAWLFSNVLAKPPSWGRVSTCGLPGESPRQVGTRFDYFVDADNGSILGFFTSTTVSARGPSSPGDLKPTPCNGSDEAGTLQMFWGKRAGTPAEVEMHDELRTVVTYDNGMRRYAANPRPLRPVKSATGDFGKANSAAVSAHVNGEKVLGFFRRHLNRSGIDGQNMPLVSYVRCTSNGQSEEWKQAVWYDGAMWYGQWKDGQGYLHSLSNQLDVIAHEIGHGVTQFTANLRDRDQPGALDESFADIFAIAIRNVDRFGEASETDKWTWEIGAGLGSDGAPLRDISKPTLTNLAAFQPTYEDCGGVHVLGELHSKAVHDVFLAKDSSGKLLFSWMEVLLLYYLCLCRLTPLADFKKVREVLLDEARTMYSALAEEARALRVAAIEEAYKGVGID